MLVKRTLGHILAAACALQCGCAALNTRPGHPDSYAQSSYYRNARLWSAARPGDAQQPGTAAPAQPSQYVTTAVPREVWQARGYAHDMGVRYASAAYKAQDVEDIMTIPLFGAAIATAAVAIARTSTVAVAATGIGAASAGAIYSYTHPDADASTDQSAAAELACLVDQSAALHSETNVPLILDRAAIEDALAALDGATETLVDKADPTTVEQKQIKAITDAQTAATKEIATLTTQIQAYSQLPGTIYKAADDIDNAAKTNGKRVLDVANLFQQIKAAGTAQSESTTAKSALDAARGSAATPAAAALGGAAPAAPVVTPTDALTSVTAPLDPTLRSMLGGADTPAARTAVLPSSQSSDPNGDTARFAAKYDTLERSLQAGSNLSPAKLNRVVETAQDDEPKPTFSDIGSTLAACVLQSAKASP